MGCSGSRGRRSIAPHATVRACYTKRGRERGPRPAACRQCCADGIFRGGRRSARSPGVTGTPSSCSTRDRPLRPRVGARDRRRPASRGRRARAPRACGAASRTRARRPPPTFGTRSTASSRCSGESRSISPACASWTAWHRSRTRLQLARTIPLAPAPPTARSPPGWEIAARPATWGRRSAESHHRPVSSRRRRRRQARRVLCPGRRRDEAAAARDRGCSAERNALTLRSGVRPGRQRAVPTSAGTPA